jgi:antitoxin VapB
VKVIVMPQIYKTRQFQAGNSQAVRLPATMAFPPKTELVITRQGDKIIVQPVEQTMEAVPQLFAALKKFSIAGKLKRLEFIESKRSVTITRLKSGVKR